MSFMLPVKYAHVQKMNVAEMRMSGRVCGHTMRDMIRNEVIRDKGSPWGDKMSEGKMIWACEEVRGCSSKEV
uniref:Putative ovule protein n=1 Tax=Solanum chacoense TaxID=4108 RepID=A0A0V0GI44_SOLCH